MESFLREVVVRIITSYKTKRVDIEPILAAIQSQLTATISDFELQERLLITLKMLECDGQLHLPKSDNCWNFQTGLPRFVMAVRKEEEEARAQRKAEIYKLQHETAWEPTRMAAFAHTLTKIPDLERATEINKYFLRRKPDAVSIPHRERALMIFGDEKALDKYTRKGLFSGRITLEDLDCFYCAEPLPFRVLSMDQNEIIGKPLLVVENANTYWSCCQANEVVRFFAAVVYGQGFKVTAVAAERANDGLLDIEMQLNSAGIAYFGDLDPTGIDIPNRINVCRKKNGLIPLYAEHRLYQALLEKDLTTGYDKSQQHLHNHQTAQQWLGKELAAIYLERANEKRWPQEGISAKEIVAALSS